MGLWARARLHVSIIYSNDFLGRGCAFSSGPAHIADYSTAKKSDFLKLTRSAHFILKACNARENHKSALYLHG